MCCSDEEQHNVLTDSKYNLEPLPADDPTRVGHTATLRVFDLKLPNDRSRVSSDDTKNDNEQDSSGSIVSSTRFEKNMYSPEESQLCHGLGQR